MHKKRWAEDERRIERHFPRSWMSRPLASLDREQVAKLHARIGAKRPYEANRVLSLLHAMIEKALAWGHLPESQGNPAARIDRFREVSRQRSASEDEIARLAQAIDEEPNIFIRAYVWLLLLTAARKNELLPRK